MLNKITRFLHCRTNFAPRCCAAV